MKSRSRGFLVMLGLVLQFALFPTAFSVASEELPWKTAGVSAGLFATVLDSKVRVGSEAIGAGVEVDVEDTLGLESTLNVFRVDGFLRFGETKRHKADFSYFDFRRSAKKQLNRDIEFGDETYLVGTEVKSNFDFQIIKLSYSYSFLFDDRLDMAAQVGAYVMPIKVGIESTTGGRREEQDLTAPLPVIGLRTSFALTEKVFLSHSLDVLYLDYADFVGAITDNKITLEYRMVDNFALGIGYDAFRIRLKAQGEDYPNVDFIGNIDMSYVGLLLYLKGHF